ncbi:zinc finger BED domain-containing protein 5-like [Carettochelys insculpta]|uniref:zinc finger BED domain-containing protein 5-like n=1 Tax=Carettochelys insculpta TaxID=44489 RepID=UPI003EB83761
MDKFLKREIPSEDLVDLQNNEPVKKKTRILNRQYHDNYLAFGFTWFGDLAAPLPECLICRVKLSNQAMVPSKLKRHLVTKHPTYLQKDINYFKWLQEQNSKQSCFMRTQEASFNVARLIAKAKKPHTIAETLILPACQEIICTMIGPEAANEVSRVPLSSNTISKCIEDMSKDIETTLIEKIKEAGKFSLQIDESTDIDSCAQLIAIVRLAEKDSLREHYLFCKELPQKTTGEEIFRVTDEYFKINGISWNNCISVCTDGAAAMTGNVKGFVSKVQHENPEVQITHCFLRREALISNSLPAELRLTLNEVVKMVNFIKSRPLQSLLFSILCEEMGAEHQSLLLHTEVRWLSRGEVLSRVYELREELKQFMPSEIQHMNLLKDKYWLGKLAYLADVFEHLNELNRKLQGRNENILTCTDKLKGFQSKLKLWREEVGHGSLQMFKRASSSDQNERLLPLVEQHLNLLQDKLGHYFRSSGTEQFDWIQNPFAPSSEKSTMSLSLKEKEEFLDVRNDRTLELKFREIPLDQFWLQVRNEYPLISNQAILVLLPFSTTYLCELCFSSLSLIKNEKRSCLKSVDQELRVALSSIEPNIKQLCSLKQAHVSH